MSFKNMDEKEALKYAFGANAFPSEFIENFEVQSKSISDEVRAKNYIQELKNNGYAVKKKGYSDFTAIMGIKRKTVIK